MRKSSFLKTFRALAAGVGMFILTPAAQAGVDDGTSFIGLPVFALDGAEVGEVVGEDEGSDGLPSAIRIAVAQPMGLGERTIEMPRERYVGLRGAVTLDATAREIDELPAVAE